MEGALPKHLCWRQVGGGGLLRQAACRKGGRGPEHIIAPGGMGATAVHPPGKHLAPSTSPQVRGAEKARCLQVGTLMCHAALPRAESQGHQVPQTSTRKREMPGSLGVDGEVLDLRGRKVGEKLRSWGSG